MHSSDFMRGLGLILCVYLLEMSFISRGPLTFTTNAANIVAAINHSTTIPIDQKYKNT